MLNTVFGKLVLTAPVSGQFRLYLDVWQITTDIHIYNTVAYFMYLKLPVWQKNPHKSFISAGLNNLMFQPGSAKKAATYGKMAFLASVYLMVHGSSGLIPIQLCIIDLWAESPAIGLSGVNYTGIYDTSSRLL